MHLPLLASVLITLLGAPTAVRPALEKRDNSGLYGTWSSGSGAVVTGLGFANPINSSFNYPKTTGISWSFTDNGFFEQAEYRFNSNGSQPSCITGIVLFQHGTYQVLDNSSIVATPFAADGRLQVQDPCAAKSNTIQQFNTTVLILSWAASTDISRGPKLQMYQFDGAPMSPMYLVSTTPNMLPTQTLSVNLTVGADGSITVNAAKANMQKAALIVLGTMAGIAAGAAALFI